MPKTKHGMCKSRLYHIWNSMKQRCSNPKAISYKYYGAKGVVVCEEWKSDFRAFFAWAMSNGYSDELTIDRKDASGDYCPENCVWATNKEQQNHTSYNRLYTHEGRTQNVMQWAEETGTSANMLYKRLLRGWSFEKALTTESKKRRIYTNGR
ncbi:MAG: hypothetical protein IJX47_02395 [Clostridia bacterium]|nr:hypothetical protein [Clostridia bacterium]